MTPARRTFTALLAASAVALPRSSLAQGIARTGQAEATAAGIARSRLIAYADASDGIVVAERDCMTGHLTAFLAG